MRIIMLAIIGLSACNGAPPAATAVPGTLSNEGELVMTVNGHEVHYNQLAPLLRGMPEDQLASVKENGQFDQMLDQVALTDALYEKAVEMKLQEKQEVKDQIAMTVRQALAQAVVMEMADAAVTDEAVKAWYDEKKVEFGRPQVKARHILVKQESKANDLLEQIRGGADFAALAKEHSVDSGSGKAGGDLGWFDQGRMVQPFAEAAFAAEKGAVIGPVETRFGFHIIEVQDKRDATPLEEVRPQAEMALRQEAGKKFTEEIKSSLKVEKAGEYANLPKPKPPATRPGMPPGGMPPGGMPPGAPPHGPPPRPAGR